MKKVLHKGYKSNWTDILTHITGLRPNFTSLYKFNTGCVWLVQVTNVHTYIQTNSVHCLLGHVVLRVEGSKSNSWLWIVSSHWSYTSVHS